MAQRAATWTTALGFCLALGSAARLRAQDAASPQAEPPTDAAQTEQMARQHFQLGRAQYEGGQFREAAASFEHAYSLSKREVLWYNIYLAYRDAGDNKQAAIALRNYVERVPELENRAQLEARLVSLDRIVAQEEQREHEEQQRAAESQTSSEPAATTAVPAESTTSDQQMPAANKEESSSIVPFVLMGVGGAMVVGGLVTGAMATSKHSELEDKCGSGPCDPSLKSLADDGKTLALTSDILLFGGLAVAATGGVLWFLDLNEGSEQEQPVSAAALCTTRACSARVALRF